MFNLNSLRKDYHHAADQRVVILDRAIAANRNLTPTENAEYEKAASEERRLRDLILDAEDRERAAGIRPANFNPAIFTGGEGARGAASYGRGSQFASLGEQIQAVVRTARGDKPDEKLFEVRAALGLTEGTGSEGGFLVEPEFGQQILDSAFKTGQIARLCAAQPIGRTSTLKIPAVDETSRADGARFGGVRGYWIAEAGDKTPSKPKFKLLEFNLKKLVILTYLTDELIEDAEALDSYVRRTFASEIGFQLDAAILNGAGAGVPLGVMNSPSLITVTKESGQAGKTVVVQNVVKMWSRLLPGSEQTAVWLINKDVLPQIFTLSLTSGTSGTPVFMPAGGLSGSPYNTLLGRPVISVEQCQTLGTKGDIVLFDGQRYLLCQRLLQVASSIHVAFTTDQSVLRAVLRVDGQPADASAITPYTGSNTMSGFVCLETRS